VAIEWQRRMNKQCHVANFIQRNNSMTKAFTKLLVVAVAIFGIVTLAQAATSVSKDSITWTFDGDYTVGQFVSGDWYIVAPEGLQITDITPGWDGDENGSMVNPVPEGSQGYNASAPGYDANINVAVSLPVTIDPAEQLISTTGKESTSSSRSYVDEAAILTVLSAIPQAGSFRPGYCDPEKIIYNTSSLNYSLLAKLTPTASAPTLTDTAELFARPWLDHLQGWTGRMIHPANNMPNYGREISRNVGIGALMLHLNYSDAEKQQLLVNYIQLGIDLYSIARAGGDWRANGGHASGRKWPILFAGLMFNNESMKNIGLKSGDYALAGSYGSPPADYINFGEDDQTFYVNQEEVDMSHGDSWDPDRRGGTPQPYSVAMIGMPEWGIRHVCLPTSDNSLWTATYRTCCTANAWNGFVLAAHIMNAQTLWNHDALFDYQDRYMAITNGDPDPFGFTVDGEVEGWRTWSSFTAEMWDTYRADYNNPTCDVSHLELCTNATECSNAGGYYYDGACHVSRNLIFMVLPVIAGPHN